MPLDMRTIKEAVTAKQVAELYGLKFDRRGLKAICPWHNDHKPSLSFRGNRCHCFVCNIDGDAIDLTSQIFGISNVDAAKRLQGDFGVGGEIDYASIAKAKAAAYRRKQQEKADAQRYNHLCRVERDTRDALMKFSKDDAWDNPQFVELLKEFALAQDTLNGWGD